jgi:hypothetical protein
MVKRAVAVHDLRHFVKVGIRIVQIEKPDVDPRPALTENLVVLLAAVGRKNTAAAVEKESGVVADAGAEFDHRPPGERQAERREVLETTLLVAQVVIRLELTDRVCWDFGRGLLGQLSSRPP